MNNGDVAVIEANTFKIKEIFGTQLKTVICQVSSSYTQIYACASSGSLLATSSEDCTKLWDISSYKCFRTFPEPISNNYLHCAFSPDSSILITASPQTVRAWNIFTGQSTQLSNSQVQNKVKLVLNFSLFYVHLLQTDAK
jgi:WD40 repeat protein